MKNIKIFFIFFLLCLCLCGCKKKEEAGILFNKEPITKANVMHASRTFDAGQKIYYLFYTPEKLTTEFIRVQVFKAADNTPVGGYSIVLARDYRVMKQNMYYYYNYIVLHNPGKYVMQIFQIDNFSIPLAWNYFYVK